MDHLHRYLSWMAERPDMAIALAAAVVALLRVLYALLSRIVAPYPRLRAAVEAVAALGPDVARALLQLARAVTGRALPSPDLDARDADLAALRRDVLRLQALARALRPPPPPGTGQSGRAPLVALLTLACLTPLTLVACPPRPPRPSDGPTTTVSGWTDTARVVLDALAWIVPAARGLLVQLLGASPAVTRALDAVADASGRLGVALDAYLARGGDRCAAHAAAGAATEAVVQLAQVLADHGLALGRPLERVADSLGSLVDTLVPACDRDAGWSSAGDTTNRRLRDIERGASARGVLLRRDLDALRPVGAP